MSYPTLDQLPDLSASRMSQAGRLAWSPYGASSAWDYVAGAYGAEPYAVLHDVYRFDAIEGATYTFVSTSYFDPGLLVVYDRYGNAVVANDESNDGGDVWLTDGWYARDIVYDWIAPYTGTYFVRADWTQGTYYTYYGITVYEDVDTAGPALPSLSISAASATRAEGSSGIVAYTFTVTRSGDLAAASSASWAVASSQASASDFVYGVVPSGTVGFGAGQAVASITVSVLGDTAVEPDESFTVTLSGAAGATIAVASATGTILNDDAATIAIAADQSSVAEGSAGGTWLSFTVTRSGATGGPASVNWSAYGAGVSGADFAAGALPAGTVSFAAGETSRKIWIQLAGDGVVEADETLTVQLSAAQGGTLAGASASASTVIRNDDVAQPTLSIAADASALPEGGSGARLVSFTVTRSGNTSGSSTVDWAVDDVAMSAWDFDGAVAPSGTLVFAPGETARRLELRVAGDTLPEGDERLEVTLSDPTGATLWVRSATTTIVNDDGEGLSGALATPVALPLTGDLIFDAMTNGGFWIGETGGRTVLSWAMEDTATGSYGDVDAFRRAFASALDAYADVADFEFNYVGFGSAAAARADLVFRPARFSLAFPGREGAAAFAGFPLASEGAHAGDVYLNVDPWLAGIFDITDILDGGAYFYALMHELGHALGLKHPHDDGGAGRPTFTDLGLSTDTKIEFTYGDGFDVDYMTVMSYNDDSQFSSYLGDPSTLMPLDVYATQALYGTNTRTNAGDSLHVLRDDTLQDAVWDASGIDHVRFDTVTADGWLAVLDVTTVPDLMALPTTLDDALAGWSLAMPYRYVAGDVVVDDQSMKWIALAESFEGSSGTDVIYGGAWGEAVDGGGGDDWIDAGAADDVVRGGAGDDVLIGGSGVDTVVYDGARGDYLVERAGGAWTIGAWSGVEGTDSVSGFESIAFADATLPLVAPARVGPIGPGIDADFLFDPVYYLLANGDVAERTADGALASWLAAGASQGRAPTAWFDADWYANRWSDLRPLALDDATLFAHFNLFGVWEGRAPGPDFQAFDGARYLRENRDVAGYVDAFLDDFLGSRTNGAIAHWILYGADEQRLAYDTGGAAIDLGYVA